MSFYDEFGLLSTMCSWLILVRAYIRISFLLKLNNTPFCVHMVFFFICLSVNGSLKYCHFLTLVNMDAQPSHLSSCFHFFCVPYPPRRRNGGSRANSVFNFKSCLTVFHSGSTILHSHQQCTEVLSYPHSHQSFPALCFGFCVCMCE